MKRNLLCYALLLVLVLTLGLASACQKAAPAAAATPEPAGFTVTFFDSDGVTVLAEVPAADGETVTMPDLTREGYAIQGYYATPALLVPFDPAMPITEDTAVFVAWQSTVEDTRAWMLAGAFRFYPDNQWGKAWPQDDYLLNKVDGEFNTFSIDVNLYAGDEFKIAVIGEGYVWDNEASIDASNLSDFSETAVLSGGENAFDSGANIKVSEDGFYRLTLKTDAETLSLCKLSYERLGDAEKPPEFNYDMKLWASFNNWEGQDMVRNGEDLIWYCEADVPAEGGEFGIKNAAMETWYSSEGNTKNIVLTEGHYMFFIELEIVDGVPQLKGDIVAAKPAYYVVGTCGNQGWAADAIDTNTNFLMKEENGVYTLNVTFTETDTADWSNGQTAFKVAYGGGGRVANEFWYGNGADNFMVDPGTYTITFDPATGAVTVTPA